MKKLLFLCLLISFSLQAQQTKYSSAEIRAVAGNQYEYIIVGTEVGYWNAQDLLRKMGFRPENGVIQVGKAKWIHSDRTNGEIVIQEKVKQKDVRKGDNVYLITTAFDLYGDKASIIKFYINFWSKALNFRDTKPGETVNVRFLSDVATLTVNKDNTAIIRVRAAKNYYQ